MLDIKKYLLKNGYDIKISNKKFILSKNNNHVTIDQLEFEKMLFIKLIELFDEIVDENDENK